MSNADDREDDDALAQGPVQVYIFNQTYNLRSGSDEEYVRRVARRVDERMRQISALAPYHDDVKVAVLAALHMADELEQVRESLQAADEPPPPPETTDAAELDSGRDASAEETTGDEDAASSPSASPSTSSTAAPASPSSSPSSSSWFDDFFDSDFTGNRGGDRLGDRLSERLHTRRQERRRPISIEATEAERPQSAATERGAGTGDARDTQARD